MNSSIAKKTTDHIWSLIFRMALSSVSDRPCRATSIQHMICKCKKIRKQAKLVSANNGKTLLPKLSTIVLNIANHLRLLLNFHCILPGCNPVPVVQEI